MLALVQLTPPHADALADVPASLVLLYVITNAFHRLKLTHLAPCIESIVMRTVV